MSFLKKIFYNKNIHPQDKATALYNNGRTENDSKAFCQAPFKSLYFGPDGQVTPCCYNRWDTLSNYNTQSLEEIWQGKPVLSLRKALKNFNPPSGCEVCTIDFHTQQFHAVKALQYDGLPPATKQPLILEFETHHKCNLSCIMCSDKHEAVFNNSAAGTSAPESAVDEVLYSKLKPWLKDIKEARFNGGEPFLSPFYIKIWDYLITYNPGCVISVQTNGTVLTEKYKALLSKGTFHISVSLDACSKEVYQQIRPPADYDKVIENIGFFRDYCASKNTHFRLTACPMRLNWKEMPGLMNFARSNQALLYFHTVWFPPALALWNLDYSTLDHIYRYLDRFKWHAASDSEKENVAQYRLLMAQMEQWAGRARAFENTYNGQPAINYKEHFLQIIKESSLNTAGQEAPYNKYHNLILEVSQSLTPEQEQRCFREMLKTPVGIIINILEHEDKKTIESYFQAYLKPFSQP